jgi:hypothetical protein
MELSNEQINNLDQYFKQWELDIMGDEIRYQATPKNNIIGFYGYAADIMEAYERIMAHA